MSEHNASQPLRLIVAGGRDFSDYALLRAVLLQWLDAHRNRPVIIVSGHARGADSLGERFARETGLGLEVYPADWDTHGKRAGFIRNSQMVAIADAAVAFWDGVSHGTLDTIKKMCSANKEIAVYGYDGKLMKCYAIGQTTA